MSRAMDHSKLFNEGVYAGAYDANMHEVGRNLYAVGENKGASDFARGYVYGVDRVKGV